MQRFDARRGFTLLELLIVVVIIGTLATLVVPRMIRTMDERYRREAKDTLYELLAADGAYRQEHGIYTANIAELPMQDPNSRTNHPLTYTLTLPGAGTTAGVFRSQATYSRRTPAATSDMTHNPALVAPGCFCESNWPVNDCPQGACP